MAQIEKSRGLIEQQQLGLLGQRSGEHHELSLAAGQLEDRPVRELAHTHPLHGCQHPVHVAVAVEPEQRLMRCPTHEHHFSGPEGEGHMKVLRHDCDGAGQLPPRVRGELSPPQPHVAAGGLEHARRRAQERRLANAVATQEPEHLARAQLEAHAAEDILAPQRHDDGVEAESSRSRTHVENTRM